MILLRPTVDSSVLQSFKKFSTSPSTPKYLFSKNKIHNTGNEKIIPISLKKNYVDIALIKEGKVQKIYSAKIIPYDEGIKIKK